MAVYFAYLILIFITTTWYPPVNAMQQEQNPPSLAELRQSIDETSALIPGLLGNTQELVTRREQTTEQIFRLQQQQITRLRERVEQQRHQQNPLQFLLTLSNDLKTTLENIRTISGELRWLQIPDWISLYTAFSNSISILSTLIFHLHTIRIHDIPTREALDFSPHTKSIKGIPPLLDWYIYEVLRAKHIVISTTQQPAIQLSHLEHHVCTAQDQTSELIKWLTVLTPQQEIRTSSRRRRKKNKQEEPGYMRPTEASLAKTQGTRWYH